MLKNYFKIAWRNIVKNKIFSFINIAGLAIGLCCFTLIALFVLDELSYDRYNKKADQIYRLNSDLLFGGTEQKLSVTSDAMGATLKKDYPAVEQFARIYNSEGPKQVKKDNVFITEYNVAYADSTLFDVFTLPAIAGDTKTALNEPNTVVITESAAKKYFGTTDAVGKMLQTDDNNGTTYKVTAVIKNIPHNSHFNFDMLFSMDNVRYGWNNHLSQNFHTYIVLRKGTDPHEFEKNFTQYINKYVLPQAKQIMQISSIEEFEKAGNRLSFSMTPLTDIHLHSGLQYELRANGSMQYVYIFSIAAIFILLIACINFMNLSTARSANRAKEVGIRKVLGTERKNLIRQFLTESTITAIISLVLSMVIVWLVLPVFNSISGKSLEFSQITSGYFLPLLLALPFIVGLLAGSYPAFFLSSFKPITVLKGKINAGTKRSHLRSSLVVIQFVISIFFIVGTIVVYRQLNYIQTKKLGFTKDQVLVIDGTWALGNKAEAFKNDVLNMPGVSSGTLSGYLPVTSSSRSDITFSKEAVMDSRNGFNQQIWTVDHDYIKTMGMKMVSGRAFSKNFGSDSSAIIINQTTKEILGYDDAVGKKIYSNDGGGHVSTYTIIGVVENFHFSSLRQNIGALCMVLGFNPGFASFKVSAKDVKPLLGNIQNKWKAMVPERPFSYRFLDDAFNQMYDEEQRVGKIAMSFALLAIIIASLGLFGLATYMAEQRTKEIGVRKVLGATVGNIVSMLSRDFLRLVVIAAVFAFPLAWWFMHSWLQDFAYRVNISWWIFIAAAVIALLIALATVSFQAIKAAIANPVKSLRTE
ncbi:MAG TPA: ABC transporter permease [Chitinophagaceae bacterium]|nr:ABC transporter permease [Chitinophagaceae bacterium]